MSALMMDLRTVTHGVPCRCSRQAWDVRTREAMASGAEPDRAHAAAEDDYAPRHRREVSLDLDVGAVLAG